MMLCRHQIAIKPQISQPTASRWSGFGGCAPNLMQLVHPLIASKSRTWSC